MHAYISAWVLQILSAVHYIFQFMIYIYFLMDYNYNWYYILDNERFYKRLHFDNLRGLQPESGNDRYMSVITAAQACMQ